jgi:repressor LexA
MGDRIKQLRIDKGLTQEELGNILGLQKSAIAKYENGRVENLKQSTIKKMAELFGVDPSYILGIDKGYTLSPKDKELIDIYNRAKESDKATVKALISAIDRLLGIDE